MSDQVALQVEETDLEAWLCQETRATASMEAVYGGFEIAVSDEAAFPWAGVLRRLLQSDHQVWLEARDGQLVIVTKSSVD